MTGRQYRIAKEPDGSTSITRTDLGCLGSFATGVAIFFGLAAIIGLFEGQWQGAGICLLVCALCMPNFAKRRRQIQAAAAARALPPGAGVGVQPIGASASLADELTKLSALRDQGVITSDEFRTIKSRLLGNDRGPATC
ncbi:MAG: SHOCT domain-containing protein [Acidimicrobiales bacterium]